MATIREPQLTYVLELLTALGKAADRFILAGAQAIKFVQAGARATRDFDFVLDVLSLRGMDCSIRAALESLGYAVIEEARNFQFQKSIPNSTEIMRVEFMAPEEFGRKAGIRVDVQEGLHARACKGGSIVIAQSDCHELVGRLPDGTPAKASIRVTRSNALIMMKLWAMHDRFRNRRGGAHYEYDRDAARVHSADTVSIASAQLDFEKLKADFAGQFVNDGELKTATFNIVNDYFGDLHEPGVTLYAEFLASQLAPDEQGKIEAEIRRAQKLVSALVDAS